MDACGTMAFVEPGNEAILTRQQLPARDFRYNLLCGMDNAVVKVPNNIETRTKRMMYILNIPNQRAGMEQTGEGPLD